MEQGGVEDVLTSFKPIFNKGRGVLDPSSPHARNAALLPFLLHVYLSEIGHLQLLISDFHANTWQTRLSFDHLKELKRKLGFNESFPVFLQNLHGALSSDEVKIQLGGPASAVGGKGATSADLRADFETVGTSWDVVIALYSVKGRIANDAVGALALDLYDAYSAAQRQIVELDANIKEEKQRSASILNEVIQGKANSIHFRPSKLPNVVQNELQPSWSDASPPIVPMRAQSPVPTVSLTSYLSPSVPSSLPQPFAVYSPGYCVDSVAKHYEPLAEAVHKKQTGSYKSVLKLSDENSYSRAPKGKAKMAETIDVANNEALPAADIYETRSCSESADNSRLETQKRKYRELNADILAKIESGGENRSVKTDTWARRHYKEWQKDNGLPDREIEELPLQDFAESLVKFFCMVKKRNGDLFPSESLKAMFRGFVRILQAHYKKLSVQGSYCGPIIDAGNDPLFEKARLSCVEAMKQSLLQGRSQSKRRKAEKVLQGLSSDLLPPADNQMTTPRGLCRRLCYYTIHKFGISGSMDLYDTTDVEFQRIVNEEGDIVWEYDEKRAEKCKSKELFRPVIQCGEKDVVDCLDKYFMHLPPKHLEEEPRRLFLAPINRPTTDVWFRHQNISSRTLLEWYRFMAPLSLDPAHAAKKTVCDSLCLLRCDRSCDGKEAGSETILNAAAMHIRGRQLRNVKKSTENETFGKIVDVQSNTDDDSAEHHAGKDDDDSSNNLTGVDPISL